MGEVNASDLYYLVRKGTNVRVLTKDEEPLILFPEALESERWRYAGYLKMDVEDLIPMSVEDFHKTFTRTVRQAITTPPASE